MPIHICPVCGAAHDVHPILHSLAYGRQLTCSPRCKTDFPRLVYSRIRADAAGNAAKAGSLVPNAVLPPILTGNDICATGLPSDARRFLADSRRYLEMKGMEAIVP